MEKTIDINQRIPLQVLHVALVSHLSGTYNEEYILEQLKLEFNGANRLKKSLRIVKKVMLRNDLMPFLEERREEILQAIKNRYDRNLILVALLNSSFSFSFDTLQLLGKYLMVQDVINRETLKKALANVYGGNRATDNAMDSVLPMFIEAGLIKRSALGIYERNSNFHVALTISKQVFHESFRINSLSTVNQVYQFRDPYFLFVTV